MASYNEDPIDRALDYWNEGDDQWLEYKKRFLAKSKSDRVDTLIKIDSYLEGDLKPTRETSSLWTKRRELENLHRKLSDLGR